LEIGRFLEAGKYVRGKVRWVQKPHSDYRQAALQVVTPSAPEFNARLVMTAHIHRIPQKSSFTLLLGSQKALRLDVEPGSTHFDPVSLVSVSGTHWQPWPGDRAIPDTRKFNHFGWLSKFLKKANIKWEARYVSPPHVSGEQLRFENL
jgi:hypothetical protein